VDLYSFKGESIINEKKNERARGKEEK